MELMDTRTTRIDLIFLHFPSVWILDTQEVSLIKWQTIKGIVLVVTSLADIVVVIKCTICMYLYYQPFYSSNICDGRV